MFLTGHWAIFQSDTSTLSASSKAHGTGKLVAQKALKQTPIAGHAVLDVLQQTSCLVYLQVSESQVN